MRYIPAFFLFYLLIYNQSIIASSISSDSLLFNLYALSDKNLIHSSAVSEETILSFCSDIESQARKAQDYNLLFRSEQISVNTYCLHGAIGLAINKAQNMYEEAKRQQNELGIALAIQAIGNTYMYSGQYQQAEATFAEAEKNLKETNDNLSKIRLTIQQLHVFSCLNDMSSMKRYLNTAQELLNKIPGKSHYDFYIQYYRTLYYIRTKNSEKARVTLKQLMETNEIKTSFPGWYFELSFHYYQSLENYELALSYCDSTLNLIRKTGNINEYKNELMNKASILRLMNRPNEACLIYERITQLGDSLNMEEYTRQIDSLRIAYWIDQMEVDNAEAHNSMLTRISIYALVVLIIALLIIWMTRKGNQKIIASEKELKAKHLEATDSIQSKSLFLSNMSHELRTPLTAIVGFSDLLTSQVEMDTETRLQCGQLIKQNSDLLLKLLNDAIDFSALKGNKMQFIYAETDVVALCQKVVETVNKVKQTSAQLYFKTKLPNLKLHTDSGRLQQVLINLLINATKFTPAGTITLTFEVDEKKNEAIFAVEDTGCGIPLEKQPLIFERFEKLHEGIQGAGLGLSICQLIIENIGGEIRIDSTYTKGARFVFTHPLDSHKNPETT